MLSAPPQNPSFAQGFARCGESANPNLWTGLIGAWHPPLGPTGLTLFDQSGCGQDGTLTNMDPTTDWVITEKGWALDFDGGNDWVQSPSFAIDGVDRTFYALLYNDGNTSFQGILHQSLDITSTASRDYNGIGFTYNQPNKLKITVGDGTNIVSSTLVSVSTNVWMSVVGVIRGGNQMELYLDGSLAASPTAIGITPYSSTAIVSVGRLATMYLDGKIASVAIWNRALIPAEIMQLYIDPPALFRFPHKPPMMDGLPAASDRPSRGILTGGRM